MKTTPDTGIVSHQPEMIVNKYLRRGLRKALDGGKGRLRMAPADLAEALGAAIDMETERLAMIRERVARRRWIQQRLASAENYFPGAGDRRALGHQVTPTEQDKRRVENLFE